VGAKTLTLPKNEKIRVLAITVANDPGNAQAAQPLYDVLGERPAEVKKQLLGGD
jgi:hypothetical protein